MVPKPLMDSLSALVVVGPVVPKHLMAIKVPLNCVGVRWGI